MRRRSVLAAAAAGLAGAAVLPGCLKPEGIGLHKTYVDDVHAQISATRVNRIYAPASTAELAEAIAGGGCQTSQAGDTAPAASPSATPAG